MKNTHEPNQTFVSDLERHLASELRRQKRFGPIEKPAGLKGVMRKSVLFLLCLATGVAAAKTVEHFESAGRKELLLARVEVAMELIEARQSAAQDVIRKVEERVDAGISHPKELAEAVHQVDEAVH